MTLLNSKLEIWAPDPPEWTGSVRNINMWRGGFEVNLSVQTDP